MAKAGKAASLFPSVAGELPPGEKGSPPSLRPQGGLLPFLHVRAVLKGQVRRGRSGKSAYEIAARRKEARPAYHGSMPRDSGLGEEASIAEML